MAKTLICGQNQFNSKNAYVRANVAQIAKKACMCAKVEQKRFYVRKIKTNSKKSLCARRSNTRAKTLISAQK